VRGCSSRGRQIRQGWRGLLVAAALGQLFAACGSSSTLPACPAEDPALTPGAAEVCGHLGAISCVIDGCEAAYAAYQSRLDALQFAALARCYLDAKSCEEVDACAAVCGPDHGPLDFDAGVDAGAEAGADAPGEVPDA
jgi:hypothetical protein